MDKLGINTEKYTSNDENSMKYSFVLINPSTDFCIQPGDIVYLLKSGNFIEKDEINGFGSSGYDDVDYNETIYNTVNEIPTFELSKQDSSESISKDLNINSNEQNLSKSSLTASVRSFLNKKQPESLKKDSNHDLKSSLNKKLAKDKNTDVHVKINDDYVKYL